MYYSCKVKLWLLIKLYIYGKLLDNVIIMIKNLNLIIYKNFYIYVLLIE